MPAAGICFDPPLGAHIMPVEPEEGTMSLETLRESAFMDILESVLGRGASDPMVCWDRELDGFLRSRLGESVPVLRPAQAAPGSVSFLVGWDCLDKDLPGQVHELLIEGGEAELYGFLPVPGPEAVSAWERRARERGEDGFLPLPLPGGKTLSRVIGLLTGSPFERYVVRRQGLCYRAILTREPGNEG